MASDEENQKNNIDRSKARFRDYRSKKQRPMLLKQQFHGASRSFGVRYRYDAYFVFQKGSFDREMIADVSGKSIYFPYKQHVDSVFTVRAIRHHLKELRAIRIFCRFSALHENK